MNPTRKRMIIMLVAVAIVLGLVFGFQVVKGIMIKRFMSAGQPPQTVSTTVVHSQAWQPSFSAVGSLRAVQGADLSFEVPGIVDEILFQSGDDVKEGAVLVRLRAGDDAARLRSLEAAADLAQTTYNRDKRQLEAKAIAQAALDVSAANLKTAQAAVAEQRATLDKKTIRAPFSGRLGVRLVDVGQYLNPGTAVVTLQALDPIFADFYLPPQQASQLAVGGKVTVRTDEESTVRLAGEIAAINPKVESSSRNVLVRAKLQNHDHRLLPGTAVVIDIPAGKPERYLTLPQTAVTHNPYGDTVFLAADAGKDEKTGKPKLQAKQAFVVTGPTRGDQIAVFEGIKEGDTVITAGQMKIQNGSAIVVNNAVQPSTNPNPKPVDQ